MYKGETLIMTISRFYRDPIVTAATLILSGALWTGAAATTLAAEVDKITIEELKKRGPYGTAFKVSTSHSSVVFRIKHFDVAQVYGSFLVASGTYRLDPKHLDESHVEIVVDATTIDTRHEQRDGHLRGGGYLKANKHPEIKFASTKIESLGDNRFRVTGDLSLLGKTLPLTVEVQQSTPHWLARIRGYMGGMSAEFSIDRSTFGMREEHFLSNSVDLFVSFESSAKVPE